MNEDKIAEIRARHESPGVMLPMEALGQAIADRAVLLAEVERQALYIEWLREKIDAERSCACSFDAPGDVCAAHSPALTQALAEIERMRALLKDPNAVAINMLRGVIALPSDDQIRHIYQQTLKAKP